ncbi:EscF/YscF/HrpA family type III secretion system needle major subunit [Mesorhizobium sp. ANAO-SY3R2]|uniref:EscF/YscF/HrpA family type III secretion system needle major subunit n=1 Tax=Mesorhizobium sp. ANAO-SY3R2 TaxID=3166644 RepID=UPI00366D1669
MAGTSSIYVDTVDGTVKTPGASTYSFDPQNYVNKNGFDLIWRQQKLQEQMGAIEEDIRKIEQNANLSDTEKMFSMQMAMNTWSAVSNLRTNMLKTVADTLKSIARNVS